MCPHALNFGQKNTGGNVRNKQEGTSVGSISGKSMNAAAIVWEREGYGGVAVGDAGCRAVGGGGEEKGGVAALTKKALPLIKIACVLSCNYLKPRYMRPEGPWQRLRRCFSNGGRLVSMTIIPSQTEDRS